MTIVIKTQDLYGSIFQQLSDEEFDRSAALFADRLRMNGFDLDRLKGIGCWLWRGALYGGALRTGGRASFRH